MKTANIYGAGISGAVCARLLAEKGYDVTVYEARSAVGGLCRDFFTHNVYCQLYGPHIFHTNEEAVVNFIKCFAEWKQYKHKVLAKLKNGKEVPVPFNFESIDEVFSIEKAAFYRHELVKDFPKDKYITLDKLSGKKYKALRKYIIKHIFKKYTAKQWGKPMFMVDKSIINRIPVKLSYDNTYFTDKYTLMPKQTFSEFIINLLCHEKITIKLDSLCKATDDRERADIEIITGPLDLFFNNVYGKLKYRTTTFAIQHGESPTSAAVTNFTDSKRYTRITNFPKLKLDDTEDLLCEEYPKKCKDSLSACYPIKETEQVRAYKQLAKDTGYLLCGRLACYEYLDMDDAIIKASELVKGIEEAR